jgi:hypothetical protein
MKVFHLTSKLFEGYLELCYNDDESLHQFTCHAQLSEEQQRYMSCYFPLSLDRLQAILHQSKSLTCTAISFQPSFEQMYARYNYKVDRKRAEDVWAKMKPHDQLAAYEGVKKYDAQIERSGVAKMYLKTYLRSFVWTS